MKKNLIALCFNFDGQTFPEVKKEQDDGVEQWLPLIPAGTFTGRDGRTWTNDSPETVIANFTQPAPFDVEHSTQIATESPEDKRAWGWIEELESRDGEIWGRVAWTHDGAWRIKAKHWRYYSPAFTYDKKGRVLSIASGGLTNKPNLHVPALNKEQDPMLLPQAIANALGLPESTPIDTAVCAINTLKTEHLTALNSQQKPDLEKFVPTETYRVALNRAENAEVKLAEYDKAQHESLVIDAISAGKVAPADKDMYVSLCSTEQGRTQFSAFVSKSAPVVAMNATKKPAFTASDTLEPHEVATCSKLGISQEQFKTEKNKLALNVGAM